MTSSGTPSASQRYLQIFNPIPDQCPDFHQFARFPPEVRWLIWEQALSHERWINIHVKSAKRDKTTTPWRRGMYEIIVACKGWKISKLFRITRESRRVALSFYRVKLPCWATWDAYLNRQEEMRIILYICPELDTFQIVTMAHFEYFAHDVWAHDPLHVGLVNLAMSCERHRLYVGLSLRSRNKNLLKQTLLRVERFAVLNTTSPERWLGDKPQRRWPGNQSRDPTSLLSSPVYRACPIDGGILSFERLPYDPRLSEEHLKQVYTGPGDPRMQFHAWFRLLRLLEIKHNHKVDYRYGLCRSKSSSNGRQDRDAATEWIRKDEKSIQSSLQELCAANDLDYPSPADQGLEQAPQQAIGFWLFSLESIEPLADTNVMFKQYSSDRQLDRYFDCNRFLDMTKHKPELCLSIMH
jgi:hypothetical protein